MKRALPPLRALRAFEAAARHLSFGQAAAELGVTPGAISHQIKALEAWLDAPLFHRLTRAIRLTDAGEAALPFLTEGFDRLSEGAARMQACTDEHMLTVSVSPGFGSLWLMPRLDKFRRAHPDIEVRIDGTDRLVDIAGGEADVAIRYGPGGYADVQSDRLFAMRATPVCSPELLTKNPNLRKPAELKNHTLLHIEWKEEEGSWRTWLLNAGVTDADPLKGPRFTKEEMAVRAALDGEGIALIGDRMAEDHIASGRLVRPFSTELSVPLVFAYFLLSPIDRQDDPKIMCFRNWLMHEAEQLREYDAPPL